MPLSVTVVGSSGTHVEVEVWDEASGDTIDHHVNVVFAWSEDKASMVTFSQDATYDTEVDERGQGFFAWINAFIPKDIKKRFRVDFAKGASGTVSILALSNTTGKAKYKFATL